MQRIKARMGIRGTSGCWGRKKYSAIGLAAALSSAALAVGAEAQGVTGTIRESTSRTPVAGAVVPAVDAAGHSTPRTIPSETGRYRLALLPAARALRIVRLGYRPVTVQ